MTFCTVRFLQIRWAAVYLVLKSVVDFLAS